MRAACLAFAALLAGTLLAGNTRAQDASIDGSAPVNRLEDDIVE